MGGLEAEAIDRKWKNRKIKKKVRREQDSPKALIRTAYNVASLWALWWYLAATALSASRLAGRSSGPTGECESAKVRKVPDWAAPSPTSELVRSFRDALEIRNQRHVRRPVASIGPSQASEGILLHSPPHHHLHRRCYYYPSMQGICPRVHLILDDPSRIRSSTLHSDLIHSCPSLGASTLLEGAAAGVQVVLHSPPPCSLPAAGRNVALHRSAVLRCIDPENFDADLALPPFESSSPRIESMAGQRRGGAKGV